MEIVPCSRVGHVYKQVFVMIIITTITIIIVIIIITFTCNAFKKSLVSLLTAIIKILEHHQLEGDIFSEHLTRTWVPVFHVYIPTIKSSSKILSFTKIFSANTLLVPWCRWIEGNRCLQLLESGCSLDGPVPRSLFKVTC